MVDNLSGGAGFHSTHHSESEFEARPRFTPDNGFGHRFYKVGGRRGVKYQQMMRKLTST